MSEIQSKSFRARVVTVSDTRSTGENRDTVGPELVSILRRNGYTDVKTDIVPDDKILIAATLMKIIDDEDVDLVITTGGTGLSKRDVTPEATQEVISKTIPGLAECIRSEGAQNTKFAWISRGIAGIRKTSIIVNVPGSERGAVQSLESVLPVLKHALEILKGDTHECGKLLGEDD